MDKLKRNSSKHNNIVKTENYFEMLNNEEFGEKEDINDEILTENKWRMLKNGLVQAAKKIIPKREKT